MFRHWAFLNRTVFPVVFYELGPVSGSQSGGRALKARFLERVKNLGQNSRHTAILRVSNVVHYDVNRTLSQRQDLDLSSTADVAPTSY